MSSSSLINLQEREALKSNLVNKEAEVCKQVAEELFKTNKIDLAICAIDRARLKNPNLVDLNSHFVCYMVHKLAAEKKNWYAVLGIRNRGACFDVIKRRYECIIKLFEPRNCSSVAAEDAIKLVNEAWGVLSDPKRREAYDMLMGFKENRNVESENQNPENNNNIVVEMDDQIVANCNKRPSPERIGGNSDPAESASSSSPPLAYSVHQARKVLVIRRNGQNMENTADKVIIITRKPRPTEN